MVGDCFSIVYGRITTGIYIVVMMIMIKKNDKIIIKIMIINKTIMFQRLMMLMIMIAFTIMNIVTIVNLIIIII